MSALTAPGFYPFTIAALILVGLVTVEIVAMVVGMSFASLLDHGAPSHGVHDGHGARLHRFSTALEERDGAIIR